MKNKPKEPPRIAVKFANMVFVLGILYSILLVVYAIYKIYNPSEPVSPAFYIISILSCGVFATLFGFGLKRLSNNLKVNLSILFFTIGITVYGFETYLEFSKKTQREIIAKQMGVPYDTRTKMEVLDDLRDSGVEAYPNIHPYVLLGDITTKNGLSTRDGMIFPLSGISNKLMVQSNENGYWMMYTGDKYGFHNSNDVYQDNIVDILITGDSFAEGWSVKSEENIGGVLQEIGFNVVNIGKSGNGPLLEFATLKEYAEPLEPKIVLWVYYVNDLSDLLNRELQSSIIRRYLNEDDYSQNLISRQKEIDGVLINYVQNELEKEREKRDRLSKQRGRLSNHPVIKILKLYNLRIKINLVPKPIPTPTPTPTPTPIFRDILQKSKQMVSDWDGKMYFVYLPDFERYSTGNEHINRDFVIQTATELDIPVIDIHKEVFDPHPDPLSLFPFRVWGHYNAEGYRLVAEAIGKRLQADGYVPIKSKK